MLPCLTESILEHRCVVSVSAVMLVQAVLTNEMSEGIYLAQEVWLVVVSMRTTCPINPGASLHTQDARGGFHIVYCCEEAFRFICSWESLKHVWLMISEIQITSVSHCWLFFFGKHSSVRLYHGSPLPFHVHPWKDQSRASAPHVGEQVYCVLILCFVK